MLQERNPDRPGLPLLRVGAVLPDLRDSVLLESQSGPRCLVQLPVHWNVGVPSPLWQDDDKVLPPQRSPSRCRWLEILLQYVELGRPRHHRWQQHVRGQHFIITSLRGFLHGCLYSKLLCIRRRPRIRRQAHLLPESV